MAEKVICMRYRAWDTKYRRKLLIHDSGRPFVWSELSYMPLAFLKMYQSIIGEAHFVDNIANYRDKFAEPGCFHRIVEKPIYYEEPILNIMGKLHTWDCENNFLVLGRYAYDKSQAVYLFSDTPEAVGSPLSWVHGGEPIGMQIDTDKVHTEPPERRLIVRLNPGILRKRGFRTTHLFGG
jgi:hypothetical protein